MAKKRSHDVIETPAAEVIIPSLSDQELTEPTQTTSLADEPIHPLMEEVQSFLNLRDELARKLDAEIEATEQKLAELKNTLASLFPAKGSDNSEDRKPKKPKTKPAAREEKSSSPAIEATTAS